MQLQIKLSTTLRNYVPGYDPEKGLSLDIGPDDKITAADIASRLGLPAGEIKFIMLNGRYSELNADVRPGDRLAFFPAVGGG